MANQYTNIVVVGEDTIVDLSADTVTADKLLDGFTAHDATGAPITGTCKNIPIEPFAYDYEKRYTANGTFKYENSTNNHSDFYEVQGGHIYILILGSVVGTRFRSAFVTTNPYGTTVDVPGTQITNVNNPAAYAFGTLKAASDGYCVVTKDNASKKGLKSYLFDVTPEI